MQSFGRATLGWRWYAAALTFLMAIIGFRSGIDLTDTPNVGAAGLLTQAYFSLGLFVIGGLDIGTPVGGPMWGQALLWLAYFGSPLLTASAVIEAVLRALSPTRWRLNHLQDHVIVVGSGELTTSYLRVLRRLDPEIQVLVVDRRFEPGRDRELEQSFHALVINGDTTHDFLLKELRLRRARRLVLLGDDDFATFETAARVLARYPKLAGKIVLHSHNLRFMRSLADTDVTRNCVTFNAYNFAAMNLVSKQLIQHFQRTQTQDVVVLAGFGRFGQTVLEELEQHAPNELAMIAIIDVDADRRLQVVEEQERLSSSQPRLLLQGDVSHPEVWRKLRDHVDLEIGEPVIILGTGDAAHNLRTSLWIKRNWPNCLVYSRTHDASELTAQMHAEHGIQSLSITELLEENFPQGWVT